jgi:hypothetical protein
MPWWADVLTFGTTAWACYEAFYALVPHVQPDQAITPSWQELPLTATNRSELFNLRDVQFFCVISNVTWKYPTAGAIRLVGRAEHPAAKWVMIGAQETVSFSCDISRDWKATFRIKGTSFKLPLQIALIKLRIKTAYRVNILGMPWRRTTLSPEFTWRALPGGYQWLEGDQSDSIQY